MQLRSGEVQSLVYEHYNPSKGCAYRVEHSGERLHGQIFPLKEDEIKKITANAQAAAKE